MAQPLPDQTTGQRPATPRWVKVVGVVLLAAVAIAVLVMVAGGGQHGPGMHAGMAGSTPSTAPNTNGSANGVGSPADPTEATRTIEIAANDSSTFAPAGLSVNRGEVVTFVVTNRGRTAHEFTLGDRAMQQEHASAMAHMPAGMAHELPNSIALEPGQTKRLTWRFGGPGTLEYGCHEPGHDEAGMRGQITVR